MARPFTLLAALAALALAGPLMLAAALLIRYALGSPVFFRQARAGKDGRTFTMIKFRTMTDACDPSGALLPDEARTPPVGRFLRRTRVDELPELWNVARGHMTFVGPRPLLPATVAAAGARGRIRGTVLPGLTGWAQVHGNALLSIDEKLAFDLWYVMNRSFAVDLSILVRTISVVIHGEQRANMTAGATPAIE